MSEKRKENGDYHWTLDRHKYIKKIKATLRKLIYRRKEELKKSNLAFPSSCATKNKDRVTDCHEFLQLHHLTEEKFSSTKFSLKLALESSFNRWPTLCDVKP